MKLVFALCFLVGANAMAVDWITVLDGSAKGTQYTKDSNFKTQFSLETDATAGHEHLLSISGGERGGKKFTFRYEVSDLHAAISLKQLLDSTNHISIKVEPLGDNLFRITRLIVH